MAITVLVPNICQARSTVMRYLCDLLTLLCSEIAHIYLQVFNLYCILLIKHLSGTIYVRLLTFTYRHDLREIAHIYLQDYYDLTLRG